LKSQLTQDGLFNVERKRPLNKFPSKIILITSKQAAAFNDFVKVVDDRFSGLEIDHLQVQVQGADAADQICEAIKYCNKHAKKYETMVLIRGGGSLEDLQAFNTEQVVRSVYSCKIPTLVGIGHEDDISLAELAADVRAATPTDCARILVPEKQELVNDINSKIDSMYGGIIVSLSSKISKMQHMNAVMSKLVIEVTNRYSMAISRLSTSIAQIIGRKKENFDSQARLLKSLDPEKILARGYSIATIGRIKSDRAAAVRKCAAAVGKITSHIKGPPASRCGECPVADGHISVGINIAAGRIKCCARPVDAQNSRHRHRFRPALHLRRLRLQTH